LYQTQEDGTITNSYIIQKNIKENHTPLIRISENGLALVYEANPYPGSFWFLHTDSDLNVIKEVQLTLPEGILSPYIYNLFEYNEELYLTMTTNGNHYLLKINDDDSLSIIYNGNIDIDYGEEYILLDNGNVIFSYKYSNGHIIRCVSVESGSLIWEESIGTGFGYLSDYKIAANEDVLYTLGEEKNWIEGSAVEQITISHIDISSGTVLSQQPLELPPICSTCSIDLDDFIYNPINNHLYLSYKSGFPDPAILLLEIDNQATEITAESYFPFQHYSSPALLDKNSVTHIKPDGSLVFVYKSYKNETEQMNLYISPLNAQLESLGTFEFNIDDLESIEHPTDILSYDDSRILITGIVPNKDPLISLEQARYFTTMINTDEILSADDVERNIAIKIYPNPATETVHILVPENINELTVYDVTGKIIHKENISNKSFTLNTSAYQHGTYFLSFSGIGKTVKKLIVK